MIQEMSSGCDAIVIGAGIIGCAIGRELARRGLQTAILEARGVGAGATQASAGVLAPYIEAPATGPLHDLAIRSLGMYDRFISELEADTGQTIEYRVCGTLEIAASSEGRARLTALAAAARAEGVEARWLEAADVASIEPQLGAHHGALLVPAHGYVVATQLTQALLEAAGRHGAELVRERVVEVLPRGDGIDVRTSVGLRRARTVVVAAGSWSQPLTADHPPVRPVRGQLVRLAWKSAPLSHILWGERCYIVPWTRGTVLVGATVEDVGFDERATAAGVRDLVDAAVEMVPPAWNASFVEVRVGLRPATPDGLPIIGPSADRPDIVYATGHYRNGVLLTPLTAAVVADFITDSKLDPALSTIMPSRFAGHQRP
jgi:glycine oxidase